MLVVRAKVIVFLTRYTFFVIAMLLVNFYFSAA